MQKYYVSDDGYFTLYKGNCSNIMKHITRGSVDMIFADPPYFLSNSGITCSAGKMTSVNKGKWDKSLGIYNNYAFNKEWLLECKDVLTNNGTIWVSGTKHNIYSVGFALQELEYKILNNITWQKANPPPNLSCRYFTHSTETILWAAKSQHSKHIFNYSLMKKENANKQMKDVWTIGSPKKKEKLQGKHPTQKPLDLLDRIIKSSTNIGNTILDPFCGSGTTVISAIKLGRVCIGIEKEKEYCDLAIRRFENLKRDKK